MKNTRYTKKLYVTTQLMHYQMNNMKYYPLVQIRKFQLKGIKMPSIQDLKFSFKVYSSIFPTFQKTNRVKLKPTLEISGISKPY